MTPRSADSDPKSRLLDAAVRLLGEGGPEALQARKLAAEVGTSTMAVYTHFGGMREVIDAVAEEGFRRLAANLARVTETADPVADLAGLALAYRRAALDNPHLYGVMFGLTAPGGRRAPAEDLTTGEAPKRFGAGKEAFEYLTRAAGRAFEAGRFHVGDPFAAAAQLWSGVHGFVTLEIAGYFGAEGHGVAQVFQPLGTSLAIGLGDAPESAERSVRAGAEAWLRQDQPG
ncbi:TetR/AcrR family transcriptional regulator [Amycolatopsis anabasis]|uniref:TetR/AcrR family transcriptional regulator n=1 Tax=Amycolatopsis anabasis TaxID=1840409 RepID=UPI00131CBE53|nr:TetR/AcrR family transcriptional regulator [Amycolatopsis anabasis]